MAINKTICPNNPQFIILTSFVFYHYTSFFIFIAKKSQALFELRIVYRLFRNFARWCQGKESIKHKSLTLRNTIRYANKLRIIIELHLIILYNIIQDFTIISLWMGTFWAQKTIPYLFKRVIRILLKNDFVFKTMASEG
jgi:hypothetical protein